MKHEVGTSVRFEHHVQLYTPIRFVKYETLYYTELLELISLIATGRLSI